MRIDVANEKYRLELASMCMREIKYVHEIVIVTSQGSSRVNAVSLHFKTTLLPSLLTVSGGLVHILYHL
jgi:hypothetical protein